MHKIKIKKNIHIIINKKIFVFVFKLNYYFSSQFNFYKNYVIFIIKFNN